MGMKKKHHAEHENAERWLLTYADLITLLLGLFVILYASSQVDARKFMAVVQAFGKIFEGGSGVMSGSNAPFDGTEIKAPGEVGGEDAIRKLKNAMEKAAASAGKGEGAKEITFSTTSAGITVHVSEKLLFDRGQAALRPEAQDVLRSLAQQLESVPNEIRVEGHTDDTPIHTAAHPDNWHLSMTRAYNVAQYLMAHSGIAPARVGVTGFGEFRPIVPNSGDENRALNRRVDIVVIK